MMTSCQLNFFKKFTKVEHPVTKDFYMPGKEDYLEIIQNAILAALQNSDALDSQQLCKDLIQQHPHEFEKLRRRSDESVTDHQVLYQVLLSLESQNVISLSNVSKQEYQLSQEGELYAQEGSPEHKVGEMVPAFLALPIKEELDPKTKKPLSQVHHFQKYVNEHLSQQYSHAIPGDSNKIGNLAFGKAKQSGYLKVENQCVKPGDLSTDKTKETLIAFRQNPSSFSEKEVKNLKQRNLVSVVTVKWFSIQKGQKYVTDMSKVPHRIVDLTEDMVKSGEWKNIDFAPLNFNASAGIISSGHEHPLTKIRSDFRQIFLQMGFEEMDTSKWVESSFWNFDSLFQGQQHPCRDMHDTFFIKVPQYAHPIEDREYYQRVKDVHEKGGFESIGLRYKFDDQAPLQNILRTHTTAVSSRYLKMIADEYKKTGQIRPHKYFSIDRVYRNETLDATHLAEFSQLEGFVIDKNLSLADLMSYIHTFFSRIGIDNIEFKPAYNPYTEPSMEIFAYHPGLKKWIEVGNSGMFRPEMIYPMGIPEGWNVVAWGCSLERPAMIEYKINEIRSLEGPNVSLQLIKEVPIARLTF